jgi:hypothetical protein
MGESGPQKGAGGAKTERVEGFYHGGTETRRTETEGDEPGFFNHGLHGGARMGGGLMGRGKCGCKKAADRGRSAAGRAMGRSGILVTRR